MDTSLTLNPLGFAGSLASGILGFAGARKQLAAQREENQRNREYNLMLARTQNQWNVEQWQRENDYNSPSAQMARYRAAGLNPDLIYGQQNLSAASPELTAGAPGESQDMSPVSQGYRSFGEATKGMIESQLLQAQIENIKADTNQKNSQTTGQNLDNILKQRTLPNEIQLSGLKVIGAQAMNDLTVSQREEIVQNIEESKQRVEESKAGIEMIRAEIDKLDFDKQQDAKRLVLEQLRTDASIRNLNADTRKKIAEANMTEQQYWEAIDTYTLRKFGLIADNEIKDKTVESMVKDMELVDSQLARNEFDLGYDKKYKLRHARLNLAFKGLDTTANLVKSGSEAFSNIIGGVGKLGARAVVKGFGK